MRRATSVARSPAAPSPPGRLRSGRCCRWAPGAHPACPVAHPGSWRAAARLAKLMPTGTARGMWATTAAPPSRLRRPAARAVLPPASPSGSWKSASRPRRVTAARESPAPGGLHQACWRHAWSTPWAGHQLLPCRTHPLAQGVLHQNRELYWPAVRARGLLRLQGLAAAAAAQAATTAGRARPCAPQTGTTAQARAGWPGC